MLDASNRAGSQEDEMATARKNELVALEERFWRAMKEKDADTMAELTADPSIITGPQGVSRIDPGMFAKMMKDATWSLDDYRISETTVQPIGDDVAVIAYKVHEDLTVDGEPVSLDAAEASTWVRKNGSWVCALHAEGILGDPYGRDRVAAW